MIASENYLDPDVAYFLGLVIARGSLQDSPDRRLAIQFPYSSLVVEGVGKKYDQETLLQLGTSAIRDRLTELLETDIEIIKAAKQITILIKFFRNSLAWRNLKLHLEGRTNYSEFSIPRQIAGAPADFQREFVRGIADVSGYIRQSNNYFGRKRRVYIELPNANWVLPVQLCNLLQVQLGVPVQLIQWGHPNTREPFKSGKGTSWAREHQVKIFAESFEPIGFHIRYKQELLGEFVAEDRERFPGPVHMCDPTPALHQFKKKPKHLEERSAKLPRILRKHFDCYWQICENMGCAQRGLWASRVAQAMLDDEDA